jgi:hypothetical protein
MTPTIADLIASYAEARSYYERNAARAALQNAWRLEKKETLWRADADRLVEKHRKERNAAGRAERAALSGDPRA